MNITCNDDLNLYRDIIILYCPEKVGSTSIVSSIRICASNKFIVFHTHNDKIFDVLNYSNNTMNEINISDIIHNDKTINPITGKQRKIYIIDIFRTPIERKISHFFQKISEIHFNNTELNISNYPMEKITKRFNDIFIHIDEIDYYNLYYKCNIINKFDFNKKYIINNINNIYYIKLRLQDFNEWSNILSEILNTKIYLIHDYNTINKNIGNMYKKFKNNYKLPYNYYNQISKLKSLNIYLDENEKNEYLEYWSKKLCNYYLPFTKIEYNIYTQISEENKFYCANSSNKHYSDDGCLCTKCSNKRKKIFNGLKNNILQYIYIRHSFDEFYNNKILLNLQKKINDNNNNNELDKIIINLINY